jgi:DUF4097 and DUF4098 domain-containing protein YvlB
MSLRPLPTALLSLTLATLACRALYAAETKNVDRTVPLAAQGSVSLESHNGSIRVQTWARSDLEIHARIEMEGSSAEDRRRFDETTVEIESVSGSVRIKSKHPNMSWNWRGSNGNNPQIHYSITAPRTARLRISDHNSRIDIRDLDAPLHIETHNSSVRVLGLSGPLTLNTHNGDAHVEFASFTGPSSVEMHNGSVELAMPSSSKFELRSNSHKGGVHSDFPMVTRTMGRHPNNVEATVNGGGPALRLSSHNGSFRLRVK